MPTQHTPGPWGVNSLTRIECPSFGLIASVRGSLDDDRTHANALLIAASPELLDLAYQYLSDLRYPPTGDSVQRRLERAAQVIAKATGQ